MDSGLKRPTSSNVQHAHSITELPTNDKYTLNYDYINNNTTTSSVPHSINKKIKLNEREAAATTATVAEEERLDFLHKCAKSFPFLGVLLTIASSILLGFAGLCVKLIHSLSGTQIAFYRNCTQVAFYATIITFTRCDKSLLPTIGERRFVAGRAFAGSIANLSWYSTLKFLAYGDATVIRFTLPIWSLIIGYLFLSEALTLAKLFAVFMSIVGVLLIANPEGAQATVTYFLANIGTTETNELILDNNSTSIINSTLQLAINSTIFPEEELQAIVARNAQIELDEKQRFLGVWLALTSAITFAIALALQRMCQKTPTIIMCICINGTGMLVSGLTLAFVERNFSLPANLYEYALLACIGAFGSAGQVLLTNALKVEQSGVVSLARSFDIVVAYTCSVLLLGEHVSAISLVGAALAVIAVLTVIAPKLSCFSKQAASDTNVAIPSNRG